MPLTVAATRQVAAIIHATAAIPARNHKFAKFICVKYHSVSTGGPRSGGGSVQHHAGLFSMSIRAPITYRDSGA